MSGDRTSRDDMSGGTKRSAGQNIWTNKTSGQTKHLADNRFLGTKHPET
jgi:hypothetical protein